MVDAERALDGPELNVGAGEGLGNSGSPGNPTREVGSQVATPPAPMPCPEPTCNFWVYDGGELKEHYAKEHAKTELEHIEEFLDNATPAEMFAFVLGVAIPEKTW